MPSLPSLRGLLWGGCLWAITGFCVSTQAADDKGKLHGTVQPTAKALSKKAVQPNNKGKAPGATKVGKKGAMPPLSRKPGPKGEPDEAARRIVAGGGAPKPNQESEELRAMRELDLELFPSVYEQEASADSALPLRLGDPGPRLNASGLPPAGRLASREFESATGSLLWLRDLKMPDLPVRWDARVVRYLEHYKNTPSGRATAARWIRKSGRYAVSIKKILKDEGLPEDVLWLALVESGFEPTAQSPAGAVGLWQFMPHGARIYGLSVDRWVDERRDPERSTIAAARYLSDLHKRFGTWELAFAAYNMGYGGLVAAIRKYNTNDFWELSRMEAGVSLETALHVPKIIAIAIVARNKQVFGCGDVEPEPAVAFDSVTAPPGTSLKAIANAAGAGAHEEAAKIERLNPQFLASRVPPTSATPASASWPVRVPAGSGVRASKALLKSTPRATGEAEHGSYAVRWGETLDDVAAMHNTSRANLQSLNNFRRDEVLRPGTVLLVPKIARIAGSHEGATAEASPAAFAVVPPHDFSYPDRQRVFYKVVSGDTLYDVAKVFSVNREELCLWNMLDPEATLQEGMTLQVFAPKDCDMTNVAVLREHEARIVKSASPQFFDVVEGQKGRKRLEVTAQEGDSFAGIARKYGLTLGMLERINHRPRTSRVTPGDRLVVYAPAPQTGPRAFGSRDAVRDPQKHSPERSTVSATYNATAAAAEEDKELPPSEAADEVAPEILELEKELKKADATSRTANAKRAPGGTKLRP